MGELFDYNEQLPKKIAALLIKKKLTLSLAESCSGGLISHRITQVPGSSIFFLGAVIAYSNHLKSTLINVKRTTLKKFGAVSRQIALEMAEGVRNVSGSDFACAVTGIAGPGGGSPEKPIGLVYIAFTSKNQTKCFKFNLTGSRKDIKLKTSNEALKIIFGGIQPDDK